MKIIGHRGYSSKAPENTMSSFKLALEASIVDMMECDVHMTLDDKLVVIHDYTIDRTSDGTGIVAEMSYEKLMRYDCGSWFSGNYVNEKYPLLQDVIALLDGVKPLVIELKREGRFYPEMARCVVETLSTIKHIESIYIKSFDHELIYEIGQLTKAFKLGLLFYSRPVMLLEQLAHCNCQFVSLYGGALSETIIKECEEASIEMMTWTIDQSNDVQAIWDASPSIGIVTNVPEIAGNIKEKS